MEISDLNDIITDIVIFFENFCITFNQYAQIYFLFLKYILVIVLIGCGVLTLLKARGIYFKSRAFPKKNEENKTDPLTKPRLIVGTVYIVVGSGILFNYLTYFLIWFLDPIPDRLIFNFINFVDIDPYALNRITDINLSIYPHEKTIYYAIAIFSFINTVHIAISIYYILYRVKNPRESILWLFLAVPFSILFGFTTFMPFIL
jgi:hypothetical protein